jgi:hypothetical protein
MITNNYFLSEGYEANNLINNFGSRSSRSFDFALINAIGGQLSTRTCYAIKILDPITNVAQISGEFVMGLDHGLEYF